LIEQLLRKVNGSSYGKSDEILLNPYNEIVLALEYRVPKEKLDRFKLCYQAISSQSFQSLMDNHYDVEQLLSDLRDLVEEF